MRDGWRTSQLPPPDRTTQMESLQTAPLNRARVTHNSNLLSSPSPLPVLPAITSQINHWPSSPYHRVCVWGEFNLMHGHSWPFSTSALPFLPSSCSSTEHFTYSSPKVTQCLTLCSLADAAHFIWNKPY